jgi:hypothetical protein
MPSSINARYKASHPNKTAQKIIHIIVARQAQSNCFQGKNALHSILCLALKLLEILVNAKFYIYYVLCRKAHYETGISITRTGLN